MEGERDGGEIPCFFTPTPFALACCILALVAPAAAVRLQRAERDAALSLPSFSPDKELLSQALSSTSFLLCLNSYSQEGKTFLLPVRSRFLFTEAEKPVEFNDVECEDCFQVFQLIVTACVFFSNLCSHF